MRLEQLENRLLMANVYWNVDSDGFWDVASNWRDELDVARVPGPDDDVFLDRPAGIFTVTHRSSASTIVRSLHADQSGFVLMAGSLTLTAASELGGAFTISGGNLDLEGPLTTAGTTTWLVGLIDGRAAGLTNAGTLTLAEAGLKRLSGNLVNAGTIVHESTSSDLVNSSLGSVTNLAGGVYDFQGDKTVAVESFVNRGLLRKSTGVGTAFMSPRSFSNEGGTIDVQSGTLQISGPFNSMVGGLSTGGVFTVSDGAILDLTSVGQTVRYSGTYSGTGAGIVRVRGGVLEVGATGATFNFPPGLFHWTGGIIAGGATGLSNTGSIALSGSDSKGLSGLFNNAGTVTNSGTGDLLLGSFGLSFSGPDGNFNNLAGGLYDLQGEARLANGVFNNAGTLRKSAGTGVAMLFNHRLNNVGGTIDVRSGTFLLQGTSGAPYPTHTGGHFTVAPGAFLDLTNLGGIQVFSGNYTGSGEGLVRIIGVVNTGSAITVGPGGANFDFPPGLFHWIEGVIDGREAPFTNRGSMTVDVNTTVAFNPFVRLKGTLENTGTILHVEDGIIAIDGESGLGNITNLAGGVYSFQGDGRIERNSSFGTGAAVHNFGTLRKTSGAGTATIDTDSAFNNVGTVEVNTGRLLVRSPVAQVNGTTLTGGTWKIQATGLLELEDHPRLTTNEGAVVLDGPAARFPGIEHLLINAGSLIITNGRILTVPVGRSVRSFDARLGTATYGLAIDPAIGNLFVYTGSEAEIRERNPDGTEVLPRIPFPEGTTATRVDLDFASEPLVIGETPVPASTLLVINGTNKTLYGIDKNNGTVLASITLPVSPGTVLGGSYHAARNTLFLADSVTIFEVDLETGELLQSFPVQPAGSPSYALNTGDLEVDPFTGNLLLISGGIQAIREMTPTGQFVRDQNFQALNIGRLSGIAVDEATRHVWVTSDTGLFDELEALFTNSGTLTLGPGSTLDVPGTFIQEASGTFTTQVGGNPASGQFGRLIATSSLTLDGTLAVELTNGFAPTTGQQFSVITFPSSTGSFDRITGLSAGRMPLFTVDQIPTGVVVSSAGSAVDLTLDAFDNATFPTTASPGHPITVSYSVRNLANAAAEGDWTDSLYLSRDATLDEGDLLLGRVEHRGGVGALSTYRESLTAQLPPLADGSYRVLVLSDSRGLVTEADRTNNVGFSTSSIDVTVPVLTLGMPVMAAITAGQDRYYRLVAPPGQDVKITASFSTNDMAEVFLRYREVPDRSNFDQSSTTGEATQRLLLATPQGGSYYVLIHGREDLVGGGSFTLVAEAAGFEIVRVAPLRGSNHGTASIELFGSQFTPQTGLSLHKDSGEIVAAQSVQFVDVNHLIATFDLTDQPTGAYRVHADDTNRTAIALDTFTVTDQPAGLVGLSILSPSVVRVGAPIPVTISINNGNDSGAIAPIIQIVATNVEGPERQTVFGEGLDILPGVLPPLYEGEVGVIYPPKPKADGVTSTFQMVVINPSSTLILWDSLKETLRPSTIPADAWDAIWQNLRPVLGNTLADLYGLLQNDARHLALLGYRINSINRLFKYEIRKANDLPAVPIPATAVDMSFPAPGLPLLFARDYGASIADRFHVGRLGRGWVDNFEYSLENDANAGVVTIRQGHIVRTFAKNDSGAYYGMPGDFATLTESAGTFQLRAKTGEVVGFRTDGLLEFLQDTNGNRLTAGYVGNQLISLTHSNGTALTLDYNSQGRVRQVTDPAGRMATYHYDASGEHLLSVSTVAGTTEYTYTTDASGPRAHSITSIGFPGGTHLFFDYDSQGRLARQDRDGGAEALTLTYHGLFYRVQDAVGNLTDVYFDDLGTTKQVLDGLARANRFGHTLPQNNLTSVIAPDGNSSTFQYDPRGNLVQAVDPLGHEEQSEYEPTFNNLVEWRDALGREMHFSYDASGDPLATSYPNGTTEEFGHDSQGNLTQTVNRRSQLIRYTYDSHGLLTRKELPDGSQVNYTYDARGNLLSATDSGGTTVMEYDAADRMTKIIYANGRFMQFAYDSGGRRIRSTDQSGFAVNYHYDAAGRLAELTDGGGQRLIAYQNDPAGRLSVETRGNGTTSMYQYDAANQLLSLIHRAPDATVLSRFDYAYDDNGRRTSTTTLEGTTEYFYDAGGQLILVSLPSGRTIRYEYDSAGNRREVTDNGVTTAYAVNEMNQYLTVGSTSQAFDADGNLVLSTSPGGPENYIYDAEGRLVTLVTPRGTWTYEYDVLGNRVASVQNGERTEYLIDPAGLGNVFAEYDGSGGVRAHFAHGLGLVSRIDTAGPAAYFQFDANGNTTELTGPGGGVLNSYSYLPFGETLSSSEAVSNTYTFAGQFGVTRDGNGLDYMRNRWYDPAQGRFTQEDPIGLASGANLYSYVRNSPVNGVDPSGLINIFLPYGSQLINISASLAPEGVGTALTWAGSAEAAAGARLTSFAPSFEAGYVSVVGEGLNLASAAPSNALVAEARVAELAEAGASEATLAAARAAFLAAHGTRGAASLEVAPYIVAAAEIAVVSASLMSIGRGLDYLYNTGDLPPCILPPGPFQKIFELCKGPTSEAPLELLDLICPVCGGIIALTSTTQRNPPSHDPNDIVGPGGFGNNNVLPAAGRLPYTIRFENAASAGGPATEIRITHPLDSDLDLDSFELGDFGLGELTIDVPGGRQFYQTRIDLREHASAAARQDLFVEVTAELDRAARNVSWTFTTLDPETLDLPINPFLGFLPPNRTSPEGEGFVNFSVRPRSGSTTGTRIEAQASIVFDANAPILTNVFVNTLDLAPPTSRVEPLPASTRETSFSVSWSGRDDADGLAGSGIASYDLFVSIDRGPFTLWQDAVPATVTSMTYTGELNRTYAFYSVGRDNVGHVEPAPPAADATIFLVPPPLTGDYNGDGIVLQHDLDLVLLNWGRDSMTLPPDWVGDLPRGGIDQDELDAVLLNWGNTVFNLPGDYNANALVEQGDLDLVLLNWGEDGTVPHNGWWTHRPHGLVDQEELDAVLLNWGASAVQATTPSPLAFINEARPGESKSIAPDWLDKQSRRSGRRLEKRVIHSAYAIDVVFGEASWLTGEPFAGHGCLDS